MANMLPKSVFQLCCGNSRWLKSGLVVLEYRLLACCIRELLKSCVKTHVTRQDTVVFRASTAPSSSDDLRAVYRLDSEVAVIREIFV